MIVSKANGHTDKAGTHLDKKKSMTTGNTTMKRAPNESQLTAKAQDTAEAQKDSWNCRTGQYIDAGDYCSREEVDSDADDRRSRAWGQAPLKRGSDVTNRV